jgi:hypothetical protein
VGCLTMPKCLRPGTDIWKTKKYRKFTLWAWGVAQVVECLPSIHESLGLISISAKKRKKKEKKTHFLTPASRLVNDFAWEKSFRLRLCFPAVDRSRFCVRWYL